MKQFSISIPAMPDYIMTVRLFISGIATRQNCSFDKIEDIKIAASEACLLLLAGEPAQIHVNVGIDSEMKFEFGAEGGGIDKVIKDEGTELSKIMLEALTENLHTETNGDAYTKICFQFAG